MIELPEGVAPNGATPSYVDFGGFLTPGLGGRVQRIDRIGNRFKVGFTLPPLPEPTGRRAVSRLIRGKTEGLRMQLPLLGFKASAPGSPVVDGNGQAGRSLTLRGFTPGYAVKEGQWFNHVRGDDMLLYCVDAQVIADSSGEAVVAFSPMLRVEPVDGDVLNFARPVIQGYVHGEELAWEMTLARHLGLEFQIEEAV